MTGLGRRSRRPALGRTPKLAETSNRNLLAQRIFAGMTDLCETSEPGSTPAADAVAGVPAGRNQLNPPDVKYVGERGEMT